MQDPSRVAFPLILILALAACATTGDKPPDSSSGARMEGAMTRPLRDLGIMRKGISEVLARAVAAPYAIDDPVSCAVIADELGRLDAVLGPDLDARKAKPGDAAGDMLMDAFQGALDLPFRGVLRRLSGAESRDRDRAAAVLAGMVRRAWLKGVAHDAGCLATASAP